MTRYRDRYRIESTRLQTWDYARPGAYFVTICTRDRLPYFGEIVDHEMVLSPAGHVVADEWQRSAELRPSVSLDSWTVMPNHFHGVIMISFDPEKPGVFDPTERWKPDTLGAIINQFKGNCTRRIRRDHHQGFVWQSRYYDHIIRNERSFELIRAYIDGNAATWEDDQLYIP